MFLTVNFTLSTPLFQFTESMQTMQLLLCALIQILQVQGSSYFFEIITEMGHLFNHVFITLYSIGYLLVSVKAHWGAVMWF